MVSGSIAAGGARWSARPSAGVVPGGLDHLGAGYSDRRRTSQSRGGSPVRTRQRPAGPAHTAGGARFCRGCLGAGDVTSRGAARYALHGRWPCVFSMVGVRWVAAHIPLGRGPGHTPPVAVRPIWLGWMGRPGGPGTRDFGGHPFASAGLIASGSGITAAGGALLCLGRARCPLSPPIG